MKWLLLLISCVLLVSCDGGEVQSKPGNGTVNFDADGNQITPSPDDKVIWSSKDHEVVKTEDIGDGWTRLTYDDGTVSEHSPSFSGGEMPPPGPGTSYDLERDGPLPEPQEDDQGRLYNDLPGGGRVYHGDYEGEL